jgi:Rrp15p
VGRVLPDITTQRGTEKALVRIATRGVVQLFNAVREQQRSLRTRLKEAGSSRKREKVLKSLDKNGFLDLLEGKSSSSSTAQPAVKRPKLEVKKEEEEEDDDGQATWNALRYRYQFRDVCHFQLYLLLKLA